MWINRIVYGLSTILGLVFLPISLITMNVGGCLVGCSFQFVILVIPTVVLLGLSLIWPSLRAFSLIALGLGLFGLLILPALSVIWLPFYGIMLGLSRLYRAAPWLSLPVGIVGIPFAVVGTVYVGILPSFGEFEQKWCKLSICESFPFSVDFCEFYKFTKAKVPSDLDLTFSFHHVDLRQALTDGLISEDQAKRWQRILDLPAFSRYAGPLMHDQG